MENNGILSLLSSKPVCLDANEAYQKLRNRLVANSRMNKVCFIYTLLRRGYRSGSVLSGI